MRIGNKEDKDIVLKILGEAFLKNKSIQFIVRNKEKNIHLLLEYCFYNTLKNGKVFLNNENNAVALILYSEKKSSSLHLIYLQIILIIKVIGIFNVLNVLKREKAIKKNHPKEDFIHLWYIGVKQKNTGKRKGTELLNDIIKYHKKEKKDFYLETSTEKNLPFYNRLGFNIINQTTKEIPYLLYILKREKDVW